MLTQLDAFLTTEGLIAGLKKAQTDVQKLPSEHRESVAKRKLTKIKDRLRDIFFDGLTEEAIVGLFCSSSLRFNPDYPGMQKIFRALFVDKSSLDQMLTPEALSLSPDWAPSEAMVDARYREFNTNYGYFQDASKQAELKQLFTQLVVTCRNIAVFVEKNNTAGDTIAYDYAYKLMALFVDESKVLPTVKQLSKATAHLLATQKHGRKPFHDVLLVKVQLPNARMIKDRCAWMAFIKKEGERALPFFAMAAQLEEQLGEKAPSTIRQAKGVMALCIFARAAEDLEFAKLCYDYKVSEKTFNSCLDYMALPPTWPKKPNDTIPNVVIKGQGVMDGDKDLAEGYYWVKLPPADKRALILGKITDCCQSIGDDSSQCVMDAVSLSDNGLYVLLKHKRGDKAASPINADGSISENFQIIGQSYAWKSKTGNICLDSIECLRNSVPDSVLKKIMFDFATQVMADDSSIKRVNVGHGGRTPSDLFEHTAIPEVMRQGRMYGDAYFQYCIKSFSSPLTSDQRAELDALFSRFSCSESFKNCVDYLLGYLTNDPIETIEQLATLLERSPEFKDELQPWSLLRFLSLNSSPKITDFYPVDIDALERMSLEQQIESLRDISSAQLIWNVSSLEKILSLLPHLSVDQRFVLVKEQNQFGQSALHKAAKNPATLAAILEVYPEDQRLEAVKEKDHFGQRALHYAMQNPAALGAILELYPEDQRLEAVKEESDRLYEVRSVLQHAVQNPAALIAILGLLPEAQRFEVAKEKDKDDDKSTLYYAAQNPDDLIAILGLLPEAQRLEAVKEKNRYGENALHYAAHNPAALAMILALYPEDQRLEAVKVKDRAGKSVLHYAAHNPTALATILELYPEDQRLEAVKEKNRYNASALHYAAQNPNALAVVLQLYPEDQRLEAVKEKDGDNQSVLCLAANHPDALAIVLTLYPEDQRLEAVKEEFRKFKGCQCALDLVVKNSDSLTALLGFLPEAQRLEVINERITDRGSVLYIIAQENPAALIALLSLLPETQRLGVGMRVLNYAVENPTALAAILELYPKDQRLAAVKKKDYLDKSTLHYAAHSPNALAMVLELYPEDKRLEAVKEKNGRGRSALYYAAHKPDALIAILELYPEDQRLEAVREKDNDGRSALHYAEHNPNALAVVLELYPEDQRLEAVKEKDREGNSALHDAARSGHKALLGMLALLPEAQRLEAAREATEGWSDHAAKEAFLARLSALPPKVHLIKTQKATSPTDVPTPVQEARQIDAIDHQPPKPSIWRRFVKFFQLHFRIIVQFFIGSREDLPSGDATVPKKKDQDSSNPLEQPHHGKGYPFFGPTRKKEVASKSSSPAKTPGGNTVRCAH